MAWHFEVVEGPDKGSIVSLSAMPLNIGRDASSSQLVLSDTTVSRLHAKVTLAEGDVVLIEDLGSSHGTYLNGQKISGKVHLNPADQLKIGSNLLRLSWSEDTPASIPGTPPSAVITIGREVNNNLIINEQKVSINHARLEKQGDLFYLTDLNSSHGTYLNGKRIKGSVTISPASWIQICGINYYFDGVNLKTEQGGVAAVLKAGAYQEGRFIALVNSMKAPFRKDNPNRSRAIMLSVLSATAVVFLSLLALLPGSSTDLTPFSREESIFVNDEGITLGLKYSDIIPPTFTPYAIEEGSFGRQTANLTSDNSALENQGVRLDLDPFFLEDTQVSVEVLEVSAPPPSQGTQVQAYSFQASGAEDYDGLYRITLPFKPETDSKSTLIGAGYFNPDTNQWDPVLFHTDDTNRQVIIITDHLSVYGAFYAKRSDARFAQLGSGNFVNSKYREFYPDVIKESLQNNQVPAIDLGNQIVGDWLDLSGGILELEGLAYSSNFLNSLSGKLGHFGTTRALYNLASDYSQGNDEMLSLDAYNLLAGKAIGKYGGKALNIAMIGVTAINYSLSRLQVEAFQMRDDNWRIAYRNYYNPDINPRVGRNMGQWKKVIKEFAVEANKSPNAARTYHNLIEGELNRYSNLFWREGNPWSYFPGPKVFASYPLPATQATISNEYKSELLNERLRSVFNVVESDMMRSHFWEMYYAELEVRDELNRKVTFIVEEIPSDSLYHYADHYVMFGPLKEGTDSRHWAARLNEKGSMQGGFTVLGHLLAGAPNTIRLYSPEDRSVVADYSFRIEERNGQLEARVTLNALAPKVVIEGEREYTVTLDPDTDRYEHHFFATATLDGEYRFDWQFGDGNTASANLKPGEKSGESHTYTGLIAGGTLKPVVNLYDSAGKFLASDSITIKIGGEGPALRIRVPQVILDGDGVIDTSYVFETIGVGIPDNAIYQWKINGMEVRVTNRMSGGFKKPGDYTIECSASWSQIAADGSSYEERVAAEPIVVSIKEEVEEDIDIRHDEIDICGEWKASRSGGAGTTITHVDISQLPVGASFDLRFNAFSVPDKFIVEYEGAVVFDSGWQGHQSYVDANPGLYPGGLSGSGSGTREAMFEKNMQDTFVVTVIGPESGTAWDYAIRANCPPAGE